MHDVIRPLGRAHLSLRYSTDSSQVLMKTVYGQAGHSPAASHASDGTGDDKRVHRGREATKERARSWRGGLISEGLAE